MNNYIEVCICVDSENRKDMLVAELDALGFEGFVEEEGLLLAFIPQDNFHEDSVNHILVPTGLSFSHSIIKSQNWNEIWEAGFRPVIIEGFCAVRASFHSPVEGVKHDIIITPKMSFGTGHHATTFMMMEAMRKIDFIEKSVIDFGTGTGILSILAEKLGASTIKAIDCDDWSIENAKENIQRNNCKHVELSQADSIGFLDKSDIVLANINKNIILQHFASMKSQLNAGGILVLSGLLSEDRNEVCQVGEGKLHLKLIEKNESNNWISLMFARD